MKPNDQRWLGDRSILIEKMKYQSYNIKARVVYELKIKAKWKKLIKRFVLLL